MKKNHLQPLPSLVDSLTLRWFGCIPSTSATSAVFCKAEVHVGADFDPFILRFSFKAEWIEDHGRVTKESWIVFHHEKCLHGFRMQT
jgi:hypothetical protein